MPRSSRSMPRARASALTSSSQAKTYVGKSDRRRVGAHRGSACGVADAVDTCRVDVDMLDQSAIAMLSTLDCPCALRLRAPRRTLGEGLARLASLWVFARLSAWQNKRNWSLDQSNMET